MDINWIETDKIYRRLISISDTSERQASYLAEIVRPWQEMMSMVGGLHTAVDPLAGPRAWNWVLPDQLDSAPECLVKLEADNAWERGKAAMERAVSRFRPIRRQIPISQIEGWLIVADPERADPIGRGYTGGVDFMQPRFVVQYSDPNDYNLPRLEGCIVHEMHHLVRSRVVPWNFMQATVGQYIVHEGLAESFAAANYGQDIVGYYVTEFDESQFGTAKALIGANLEATGFDTLRAFIFGDYWAGKLGFSAVGMPDFGGYAIGYRVVQAFLERTGTTIEEATFLSARVILDQSGYFDV